MGLLNFSAQGKLLPRSQDGEVHTGESGELLLLLNHCATLERPWVLLCFSSPPVIPGQRWRYLSSDRSVWLGVATRTFLGSSS